MSAGFRGLERGVGMTGSLGLCHLQESGEADTGVSATPALTHAALTGVLLKALVQALQRAIIFLVLLHVACTQTALWQAIS